MHQWELSNRHNEREDEKNGEERERRRDAQEEEDVLIPFLFHFQRETSF